MKTLFFCCYILLTVVYGQKTVLEEIFPSPGTGNFIYHPPSKALLLLGGSPVIADSSRSNVWKWDGKSWSQIEGYGPGSRDFFTGSLNSTNGIIYFFAGQKSDGVAMGDMWSFDGKKWSPVITNNIGTRDHHNMVYADHLDAFVLYGGAANGKLDSTTWIMKNGQFTALNIPGPGARYHAGMVYDKYRKKVVLYGGGERPDEHWEFDGVKWTKITNRESPGRKLYHQMVYDDNLRRIILLGGWINQNPRDSINGKTTATWEWNGSTWRKISEERIFPNAMGYDENRKVVVAWGRTDNSRDADLALWELKNDKWSKIADYGKWIRVDYLKKWVKQNPDDMQALAKYADILQWETKQFAEAEAAYKKLVKAYPEKTNMFIDLALVLLMQSKVNEAEVYLAKAGAAGLINRNTYIRLAGLLGQEKKYPESIKYQLKALEMEPNGNDFYNLARSYALAGEKDKAFEVLNKAVEHTYNLRNNYETHQDFESLKSDPRWKVFLEKLK